MENARLLNSVTSSVTSLKEQVEKLRLSSELQNRGSQPTQKSDEIASIQSELSDLRDIIANLDSSPPYKARFSDQQYRNELSTFQSLNRYQPGVQSSSVRLENIKSHFLDAQPLDSAHKISLENVSPIFESDGMESVSLERADCVDKICRIEYAHTSSRQSATDRSLLENELILQLGEKYGNGSQFLLDGTGQRKTLYVQWGSGQAP